MTRDQFLCEMMGERLRIFTEEDAAIYKCPVDILIKNNNPDFSTPADAYRLMQFVMKADWWDDFYRWASWKKYVDSGFRSETNEHIVAWLFSDPDRFATLVAEYRGWQHD